MSGCPNGCGLHHIANIGFHGAAVKGPDGEGFNKFLDRVGLEELTAVAAKAQEAVAEATPDSDLYVDWERTNQYKLERGEGECAV